MSHNSQNPHSTGRAEAGRMENLSMNRASSPQSRVSVSILSLFQRIPQKHYDFLFQPRKRNSGFKMPDELTPR